MKKKLMLVRKLGAEGHSGLEIARRTGLSQDAVGLLMAFVSSPPTRRSASGAFARVLDERLAS